MYEGTNLFAAGNFKQMKQSIGLLYSAHRIKVLFR